MLDGMQNLPPETVATRPTITVKPERGRATTWSVTCTDPEHKRFPGAPKSKRPAIGVAIRHRDEEHEGDASIKVRGEIKVAKR